MYAQYICFVLSADFYLLKYVRMYIYVCIGNVRIDISETSLIQHSMGPENNVRLGGCWITEGLFLYFNVVTVPH